MEAETCVYVALGLRTVCPSSVLGFYSGSGCATPSATPRSSCRMRSSCLGGACTAHLFTNCQVACPSHAVACPHPYVLLCRACSTFSVTEVEPSKDELLLYNEVSTRISASIRALIKAGSIMRWVCPGCGTLSLPPMRSLSHPMVLGLTCAGGTPPSSSC